MFQQLFRALSCRPEVSKREVDPQRRFEEVAEN
jgi:hypothetical protein